MPWEAFALHRISDEFWGHQIGSPQKLEHPGVKLKDAAYLAATALTERAQQYRGVAAAMQSRPPFPKTLKEIQTLHQKADNDEQAAKVLQGEIK